MSGGLRTVLTELADQMPPASPGNVWQAGRRMRRRDRLRLVTRLAVALVVLACLVPPVLHYRPLAEPAGGAAAVPGRVWTPWMWQGTVAQDPTGPAALLFSGDGLGLRGTDLVDHEGKVAVVGRDGSYRMLLYGGAETVAGEEVQVSPDGRYVVQGHLAGAEQGWLVLTDLVDGRSRTLAGPDGRACCGVPVAWAPDGAAVLAMDMPEMPVGFDPMTGMGILPTRLVLHDLTTGQSRVLVDELGDHEKLRTASLAAFSPDGRWIAVSQGSRVSLLGRTGGVAWTRDLGPGRHLAGPGAFTPDGRQIATLTLHGCRDECDTAALAARSWQFGYLDAATGTDGTGPGFGPVTAMAVRVLGWRLGTDPVALTYRPEDGVRKSPEQSFDDTGWWEVGDATLVALRPGGGAEVLVDSPGEVLAMDVPRDLLESGRFGGPARPPAPFPARPLVLVAVVPLGLLLIAVGVPVAVAVVRRRRHRIDDLRHM
ncbi:WD40 repeat domain-containing protein [Plantactinospora endophytica]|uniref:WD40 repeat domain-containing protein n=1 Tax=Plantactinospora endophytica TaxID=673535 RepID=A0ABQ4DWQ7_9ACTN|nr:hypothetical protein [Plantactinospora endophytica]GIG86893.1 hypothetical protein Pen02_18290 [Plantactinospora endophytica]